MKFITHGWNWKCLKLLKLKGNLLDIEGPWTSTFTLAVAVTLVVTAVWVVTEGWFKFDELVFVVVVVETFSPLGVLHFEWSSDWLSLPDCNKKKF